MAYSILNTQTNTANGSTSLVITKPTGIAAGDILIAAVCAPNFTPSLPAGWTDLLGTSPMRTAFKVVTGSEGASFTWTSSSTQNWVGIITAIRGIDKDLNSGSSTQQSGSGTTATFGAVLPPGGGLIIAACGENSSPTAAITWPPSGFTSISNVTNGGDVAAALSYKADCPATITTPGNVAVDAGVFTWQTVVSMFYKRVSQTRVL